MIGKNILIVEDDAIIAEDLKDILLSAGYVVTGVAANAKRAEELLSFRLPDLVLLDITLKQNSTGIEVARMINMKYQVPFIYITSYSDQQTMDEAIVTEPIGYIIKPFQSKDIIPTVRLALASNSNQKNNIPSITSINNRLLKPLSPQEYSTLALICRGKTNPEIAEELHISVNTAKTHIKRIYVKLNVDSKLTAVRAVMRMQ